ncbi:unnamed protein product [Arabidopsis thaliana]|uniref:Vitellogenin-like protein n=3 Tax=Arabidopsis TaxID=3701 RepID=A0A654G9K8_ARATH|nr:hypothetical protein ISN44_As05g043830 [Arabidopsis suecica]VYS69771.1 unnamed protein product [Arabidopsis thaliana]
MVEAKDQDMGDGMQCINHPFTKNPGGICAFCLQEKLGKLVTSSFPLPKHLTSSSTSSSPSFRSDSVGSTTTASAANLSASLSLSVSGATNNNNSKLPFLLAKKKKKMLTASSSSSTTANIVYKRSQSTRTTKTTYGDSDLSPRKRNGFWSFFHLYSSKQHGSSKKVGNFHQPISQTETKTELAETTTVGSSSSSSASSSMSKRVVGGGGSSSNRNGIDVIVEEDGSPNIEVTPSERKVSRSRSVGCGSRSFSGDFFERITNGFGDCTLRRVESQREGNNNKGNKVSSNSSNGVREMVRCGGIFGGFMIMTSSSSSSSSSSWVSSSSAEHHHHHNHNMGHGGGGRNRSWGWSFASPMRAFTSSSYSGKRGRTISDSTTSKNTTPNLGAIPSLLSVRS